MEEQTARALREYPWDEARADITRVDQGFAALLNQVYIAQVRNRRSSLQTYVAEYPYGDLILENGIPKWPHRLDVPQSFIIADGLPLGIIVSNSCEVTEFIPSANDLIEAPDTILMPGEMIGLFESVDVISGVQNPPRPSWNIRAGVSSIYTNASVDTRKAKERLEKALDIRIDLASFNGATTLLQLLKLLVPYSHIQNNWRTRIVYFSNAWLDLIRKAEDDATIGKLRESFLTRAWKNLARLRDKDPTPLQKKLKSLPQGKRRYLSQKLRVQESIDQATAGLLMKRARDVLERRQPCYIPTKQDSLLGPFGSITSNILAAITPESCVLAPTYAPSAAVGYMKLDHVLPSLSDADKLLEKINDAMGVIRLASERELGEVEARRELDPYLALLSRLTFQLRGKSSSTCYRFSFDAERARTLEDVIEKEEFYKPYFNTIPAENNIFFRSSIRMET